VSPGTQRLRGLVPSDLDAVLALNRAAEPGVGPLDAHGLAELVELADHSRVVTDGDRLAGALIALLPERGYASPNYRWFDASGVAFLYVDRVMVAAGRRGAGVGRRLYEDTVAAARAMGLPRVVCEVNEDPPNPASLAFHIRLGFQGLCSRTDPRDGKRVLMMELPLA
jgi:predicted GNAT superfamily acetyltransferase